MNLTVNTNKQAKRERRRKPIKLSYQSEIRTTRPTTKTTKQLLKRAYLKQLFMLLEKKVTKRLKKVKKRAFQHRK